MLDWTAVVLGVVVVTVWVTVGVVEVLVGVLAVVVGAEAAVLWLDEPHAASASAASTAIDIRHIACEYPSRSGRTPRAHGPH
jgi:TctA family transporter